jgi:hypothetical protein
MKNRDDPFTPSPFANAPPGQGYVPPPPMMGGALAAPKAPEPPTYAQFEVGKNGLYVEPKPQAALSEDALPPMPSWDAAAKKHVLTEEEKAIELGELDPATGQKMPLMSGAAATGVSAPPSPGTEFGNSPFGARPAPAVSGNGYMGVPGDQYGQQNRSGFNASPNPSMGGAGRYGSPAPGMGGQSRYGSPAPQSLNSGRVGPDGYGSPGPQAMNQPVRGYGPQSPHDPYGPQDPYASNDGFNGAGGAGGYGRPPQRQYPNDPYSNDSRQFAPPSRQYTDDSSRPLAPGRQYTDNSQRSAGPGYPADNFQSPDPSRGPSRGPGGPQRLVSPPLNNSGFDFGGGYQSPASQQYNAPQELDSRPSPPPQQGGYGGYGAQRRRPSPPQENNYSDFSAGGPTASSGYGSNPSRGPIPQEATYPGYQSYQPAGQSGGGPRRSPRGGREPQGWDPVHQ